MLYSYNFNQSLVKILDHFLYPWMNYCRAYYIKLLKYFTLFLFDLPMFAFMICNFYLDLAGLTGLQQGHPRLSEAGEHDLSAKFLCLFYLIYLLILCLIYFYFCSFRTFIFSIFSLIIFYSQWGPLNSKFWPYFYFFSFYFLYRSNLFAIRCSWNDLW